MQHVKSAVGLSRGGNMSELEWECVNCARIVTLDPHGRCDHCGSEAVTQNYGLDPLMVHISDYEEVT
jgi:rRNA maturation endonuclease Nob1